MKNIKNFEEYSEEISEKNNNPKNVEIFKKQHDKIIAQNKEYNWEAIPDSDKKKDSNYKFTIAKEIPINDPNPVEKFKKWNGKYWRKKKDKNKKYETN